MIRENFLRDYCCCKRIVARIEELNSAIFYVFWNLTRINIVIIACRIKAELGQARGLSYLLSRKFGLSGPKSFFFWKERLGAKPFSCRFWHFSVISWFPKILTFQSFGNSWANRVYNSRCQVPLCLWWIKPILKGCTVSKYHCCDCL